VDVRIIAATNADLHEAVRSGAFLPDLLDRLSFEELHLPPLRERREDIPLLAEYFFQQFLKEIPEFRGKTLSQSAFDCLLGYDFPGNIRELKHIIERAIYRDRTNEITADDIGVVASMEGEAVPLSGDFMDRVECFKRNLILSALAECNNNQRAAARSLGLSYHQYRYFLGKYRNRSS
jgi:transcriptional regulator with GAF, ATPase, and Fis domain